MQYTKLGNSGLTVSRICMGCMGFGDAGRGQHSWTLDEEHSREIIRRGLDLGVNFFDTAIAYQSGTSEQYLGRALRDFARRDQVVVATKFLPRTPEEIQAGVSGQKHIQTMLDASLKNLGMDYVDLYIYHMWDYETPLEEILEGLNDAVRSGKARAIGISNCFAWQLAKANALAASTGNAELKKLAEEMRYADPTPTSMDGDINQMMDTLSDYATVENVNRAMKMLEKRKLLGKEEK